MNESSDSKFVTRKWNIINDQSNKNSDAGNEIIYDTEVLKSIIWDFNYTYILVRGDIVTAAHNNPNSVALKNCAPLIKCITKTDEIAIDDVEGLDLVMLIYNLIESSSNYSETTGNLWFYSKNKATNFRYYGNNRYYR